jgi:hypothetical protein
VLLGIEGICRQSCSHNFFGTCTSALAAGSNGLVGFLTTFRVPDKLPGQQGSWSLVCTKTFPDLDLPMLAARGKMIFFRKRLTGGKEPTCTGPVLAGSRP